MSIPGTRDFHHGLLGLSGLPQLDDVSDQDDTPDHHDRKNRPFWPKNPEQQDETAQRDEPNHQPKPRFDADHHAKTLTLLASLAQTGPGCLA